MQTSRTQHRADPSNALELQQEIAEKRADLVANIDQLRDTVRDRLDVVAQLRAHPRLALGLSIGVALTFALGIGLFVWRTPARLR